MTTYSYESALATSQKVNWKIEDILGPDDRLDFSRPFLPESLARAVGARLPLDGRGARR